MKIPDNPPPVSPDSGTDDSTQTPQAPPTGKPSPFASLLKKKHAAGDAADAADLTSLPTKTKLPLKPGQTLGKLPLTPGSANPTTSFSSTLDRRTTTPQRETRTAPPPQGAPAAVPQGKPEPGAIRSDPVPATEVRATGSTDSVEQMQALANEMVDRVQASTTAAGNEKVDIQFNSRTLEGLQVSITRNEGKVSVQFATGSDHVSQLLTQNVGALTQAMAARGIDLNGVQIVPTTASASEAGNRYKEREGRQGGKGGSGGGGGQGGQGGQGGGQGGSSQ